MSDVMNSLIQELYVLTKDEKEYHSLFDTAGEAYVIPLYQRAYAWTSAQLNQMLDDLVDEVVLGEDWDKDVRKYYLGTLVVSKQGNDYEVVDGQQRLTSLYLLLNCLGVMEKVCQPTLRFASREKSNKTLAGENIQALVKNPSAIDSKGLEEGLLNGIKTLSDKLQCLAAQLGNGRLEELKARLKERLTHVVLYRIEVPPHTDLNRYFEIMNTRGEQLEQHDILKARLMSALDSKEHVAFARIWEACAEMTGYVQMHFSTTERTTLFGKEWSDEPRGTFADCVCALGDTDNVVVASRGLSLLDVANAQSAPPPEPAEKGDDVRIRFESIIDFPHFLLHALRVFKNSMEYSLDDKRLLDIFGNTWEAEDVRGFIACLLRCRYRFDHYILKREYDNNTPDGAWSLKSLKLGKDSAYYVNTFEKDGGKNLMLQAALRVSYTAPHNMHWISSLLIALSEPQNRAADACLQVAEGVAQKAVADFLQEGDYALGVATPHIVFNYLDYLLWCDNTEQDFRFEFRDSVEHWYPRHPSKDSFEVWEGKGDVDQFGNLCLIQRNANARFSNLAPEAKRSTYKDMIAKGSLKLREMSNVMQDGAQWRKTQCREHGEKMLKRLYQAVKA